MEREEGEMSDENMLVDEPEELSTNEIDINLTMVYKPNKNGVFIEQLEKTDARKLEDRAKRFGLDLTGPRAITQKQIDELYENFNIKNGNERHIRFDTLHLSGVGNLNTKEIFEYLEDYKPVSLEWIDRMSCNVVCQDHISAALAILAHSREIKDQELKTKLMENNSYHWREGFPHPKQDFILFRFATKSDKKDCNIKMEKEILTSRYTNELRDNATNAKNPWGDLCQTWGVYDHQEVFNRPLYPKSDEVEIEPETVIHVKNKRLAKRLGKRRQIVHESEESDSDTEWKRKIKTPRMRMHADDEESKEKKCIEQKVQNEISYKKDDLATLSIEIINEDIPYAARPSTVLSDKFKCKNIPINKDSIKLRLGEKIHKSNRKDDNDLSDRSSDSSVTNNSRVHKVNSTIKTKTSNVWSRLDRNREKLVKDQDKRRDLRHREENDTRRDLRHREEHDTGRGLREEEENDTRQDLRQRLKLKKTDTKDLRSRIHISSRKGKQPLRIEIDNEYYDDSN